MARKIALDFDALDQQTEEAQEERNKVQERREAVYDDPVILSRDEQWRRNVLNGVGSLNKDMTEQYIPASSPGGSSVVVLSMMAGMSAYAPFNQGLTGITP